MTIKDKAEFFKGVAEDLEKLNAYEKDSFIFTEDEKAMIDEWFKQHSASDDGNSGRYKMPKHYLMYKSGVIPRAGLYKGVECACGKCYGGLNGAWNES